jgi:hypothetical protein
MGNIFVAWESLGWPKKPVLDSECNTRANSVECAQPGDVGH